MRPLPTAGCEHPFAAVRWDPHRAVLRCTACGRELRDVACNCLCHDTVQPGLIPCPQCDSGEP